MHAAAYNQRFFPISGHPKHGHSCSQEFTEHSGGYQEQ
jgi:hypothetical protein